MENREELGLTHPWDQEQKYDKVMEPRVEGDILRVELKQISAISGGAAGLSQY